MIYPYKMFFGHEIVIFMEMYAFFMIFLIKSCIKGTFFKVDFFIGKCIFEAVFFQHIVCNYLKFIFKRFPKHKKLGK
jgi:hypothetical protein